MIDARPLLSVLAAEEKLYTEMRELLQEERQAIVRLDAEALSAIVDGKATLAAEARFLEESRIEVASKLAKERGIASDNPTLSEICAELGDEATELTPAHTRLVSLLGAVGELVEANAEFAGASLSKVRGTLELFGRLLPEQPTYVAPTTTTPLPSTAAPRPSTAAPVTGRLVRRSA